MAAEFTASAAANAVGNLATEYASPYVGYFFRFGEIVEEFKNQRKQLELKKDRVKNDVEAAIRQTEVIEKDVQEWLKEAEKELRESQRLEVEIERQRCFNWCPSWGWRYCLSKKVAKKTPYITKLLHRSNFQQVGIHRPLQGIELFPSKDFKSSKSSKLAFDGIMRALNTTSVNMIGLFGMPGVGKTTLAKEVGRQAKEQKLFDNVLMVTMSQHPKISAMQGRIAELLGLEFKASTEEGKAEELMRRLKGVKKILIIIDDVWKEFSLQTIGIPFGVEHEDCKIVLTTRRQQVCVAMNCQEKFQLDILSKDEAWALFKDIAGLKYATSTLINEAKEVASECKGLPLAIVTIGKALKGADLNGWKAANQRLKDSRHLDNEDVCEGLYDHLKLSYDYLKGDNIRSCFLLCSLFPEDFYIGMEWLIMYGIGCGLFSNIFFLDVLRVEIREALRKLQESGLLLKNDDDYDDNKDEIYVRMHDVVRDFAHWITLREKNAFMVKEGLTEWPIIESFGCYTSISLWKSNINDFPEKLEFPKLKMLVFEGKNLVRVPSAFIEGMKALQILQLKNVSFSLEAFKIVRNLRTLCFEDCQLQNISSLKNLENLEIFALLRTNIYELPEDLVGLRRLKSLHLFYYPSQQINFPPNLLSRLTTLQELHVTCENNVNLSELNSLSRLTALSLRVSSDQSFPENFVFPAKLQSFMIAVNENYLGYMRGLRFRTLKIKDFSSSLSAFKELIFNVEKLALKNVAMESIWELQSTHQYHASLKCLKEEYQVPLLSNLTSLELKNLPELKWIWKGPSYCFSLKSLKVVKIFDCNRLKYLFSPSLAQSLVLLQQLQIIDCNELEHIITESENDDNIELDSGHLHPRLLPKLTSVDISGCERLEYVSQIPSAQGLPHLEYLVIIDAPQLKHVFNVAKERKGIDQAIAFPCLKRVTLENLMNLSCFCSENYPFVSPFLESLSITDCPQLDIFNIQQVDKKVQLKYLYLRGLRNEYYTTSWEKIFQFQIEEIFLCDIQQLQGPIQSASFQYLRQLRVVHCNTLKSLFPAMVARNLSQLIILKIGNCEKLEEIIEMDQTSIASSSSQAHLQPISFSSLEHILIEQCNKLESLLPISVIRFLSKLKEICIHGASKLKQVFGYQVEINVEDDQKKIVFRALKKLKLSELPSINSFAPVDYHFQFPSLDCFEVIECPKLITSFNMDSKHHVHAITEEPQQAHNNTTKDLNTMEEIVDKESTSNDISWRRKDAKGQTPLHMEVGETRIMLRNEAEK